MTSHEPLLQASQTCAVIWLEQVSLCVHSVVKGHELSCRVEEDRAKAIWKRGKSGSCRALPLSA